MLFLLQACFNGTTYTWPANFQAQVRTSTALVQPFNQACSLPSMALFTGLHGNAPFIFLITNHKNLLWTSSVRARNAVLHSVHCVPLVNTRYRILNSAGVALWKRPCRMESASWFLSFGTMPLGKLPFHTGSISCPEAWEPLALVLLIFADGLPFVFTIRFGGALSCKGLKGCSRTSSNRPTLIPAPRISTRAKSGLWLTLVSALRISGSVKQGLWFRVCLPFQ